MFRSAFLLPLGLSCLSTLGVAAAAGGEPAGTQAYRRAGRHMGTSFVFTAYASSREQAERAIDAARRRIEEIEQAMSDYRADSEIRRLADSAPHAEPVAVSDDLRRVLEASRQIGRASDGAFDVTVGPLSELWRTARKSGRLPDDERLKIALRAVGPRRWRLTEQGVQLLQKGVQLDLGGIAKGYALDEALKAMRKQGVGSALVNGGGDVAASDPPPDRQAWRIAVAAVEAGGQPQWVVPLVRGAVATSGDAWQFVEIDGRRYSHLLDPRTGLGIQGRHAATVVAPTAMAADGWASALCVLGPDAGLRKLAEIQQAAAVITVVQGDRADQRMNDRFRQLAEPLPAEQK